MASRLWLYRSTLRWPRPLASLIQVWRQLFLKLASEGYIDAVIGGPPCHTHSVLRFIDLGCAGAPRPLRARRRYAWGAAQSHDEGGQAGQGCEPAYIHMHGMLKQYVEQVRPAYWKRQQILVVIRFRRYLQHWNTSPSKNGVGVCGSSWINAALVAPLRKATVFSGNVAGLGDLKFQCPGISPSHRHDSHHGRSGRELSGAFRSKRLGAYPAKLATWMAGRLVATFVQNRTMGRGPAMGERATGCTNRTTS